MITCYTRTLCIICGNTIINNQTSGRLHCRIAHLSCTKRYWDKSAGDKKGNHK